MYPDFEPYKVVPGKLIPLEASDKAYLAFAGNLYYLKKWRNLIDGKKGLAGFNFWAFLLSGCWFFYRKMPYLGLIIFFLEMAIIFYVVIAFKFNLVSYRVMFFSASLMMLVVVVFSGFYANFAYFKKAKSSIELLLNSPRVTEDNFGDILQNIGGVSAGSALLFLGVNIVLSSILNLILIL